MHYEVDYPESGRRRPLPGETPDAVKVFEAFKSVVLVSDPSNATMLDCLQASRSEMNTEQRTATYTWILPKIGQTIPLYVKAGDSPDSTVSSGKYHYTDFHTCLVLDIDFQGYQCMLVASPRFENSVPQECIYYFRRTCGRSASLRSRDHCNDDENAKKC
ncbi:hypothetical protein MRX96_000249 [Rhipicephalus microplus]